MRLSPLAEQGTAPSSKLCPGYASKVILVRRRRVGDTNSTCVNKRDSPSSIEAANKWRWRRNLVKWICWRWIWSSRDTAFEINLPCEGWTRGSGYYFDIKVSTAMNVNVVGAIEVESSRLTSPVVKYYANSSQTLYGIHLPQCCHKQLLDEGMCRC